jgi:hypothetical protein
MNDFDHIPNDILHEAAVVALKQIRQEKHDPNWVPRFHNGRELFEERLSARLAGGLAATHHQLVGSPLH